MTNEEVIPVSAETVVAERMAVFTEAELKTPRECMSNIDTFTAGVFEECVKLRQWINGDIMRMDIAVQLRVESGIDPVIATRDIKRFLELSWVDPAVLSLPPAIRKRLDKFDATKINALLSEPVIDVAVLEEDDSITFKQKHFTELTNAEHELVFTPKGSYREHKDQTKRIYNKLSSSKGLVPEGTVHFTEGYHKFGSISRALRALIDVTTRVDMLEEFETKLVRLLETVRRRRKVLDQNGIGTKAPAKAVKKNKKK